jgi:signal peptidase
MDFILTPIKDLANMKIRQLILQIVVLGTVVSSALMMWKSLILITHSESPIVVVLT